ncbi:hypothetical protein O0L34_g16661 [Tuta absoluta]|nr:hypothetical protein O0L34_g16661 [Tuta absoluta]
MESKIQKQIVDYFSYFEEFHNSSKTCLKDCQNCAIAINKLILRCRRLKGAEIKGTPLEEFEEIQERLSSSLHNIISEEIADIKTNLSKIEELFEKLCIKHHTLTEICREVNFEDKTPLVSGTPLQPPLKQLLEFAEDTITFGSEICAQIDTSVKVLTLKGLNADSQIENLKISPTWQLRVPEILAYTSFCADNQV